MVDKARLEKKSYGGQKEGEKGFFRKPPLERKRMREKRPVWRGKKDGGKGTMGRSVCLTGKSKPEKEE